MAKTRVPHPEPRSTTFPTLSSGMNDSIVVFAFLELGIGDIPTTKAYTSIDSNASIVGIPRTSLIQKKSILPYVNESELSAG